MYNQFTFFPSYWEAIEDLPREIQGEVLIAIIEYGVTGKTTVSLKPIANALFKAMRPNIDMSIARRNVGKTGGAPVGSHNNPNGRRGNSDGTNQKLTKTGAGTNQKLTKTGAGTNQKLSDKDKDKDKEKDNKENLLTQVKESAASAVPPQLCGGGEEEEKEKAKATATLSKPPTAHDERDAPPRFRRPTEQEVADYVAARGYQFSAAAFCAYYDSVGWVVGRGKPMKDWRGACRTWQQRRKEEQEAQQGRGAPPPPRDPSKFVNDRWAEEG